MAEISRCRCGKLIKRGDSKWTNCHWFDESGVAFCSFNVLHEPSDPVVQNGEKA